MEWRGIYQNCRAATAGKKEKFLYTAGFENPVLGRHVSFPLYLTPHSLFPLHKAVKTLFDSEQSVEKAIPGFFNYRLAKDASANLTIFLAL